MCFVVWSLGCLSVDRGSVWSLDRPLGIGLPPLLHVEAHLPLFIRQREGRSTTERERESTCRLLVTLVFMGPPGPVITALLLHGRVCLSARSAKWDMQLYLECGAARPTQWRVQDERQGGAETIEMLICVKI